MAWTNSEVGAFFALIGDLWPQSKLSPGSERAREWVAVAGRVSQGAACEALRRLYREQDVSRVPTPSQFLRSLSEAGGGLPGGGASGRVDKLRLEARSLHCIPTIQAGGYTWEVHADTCLRDRGDGQGYLAMPWGLMPEGMRQQVMDAVRRGVVAQQASEHGLETRESACT